MKKQLYLATLGVCGLTTLLGQIDGRAGAGSTDGPGQPDVILSNSSTIRHWGVVDGIHGYSIGSTACNIGDANLLWGRYHQGTPTFGMNTYRLEDGRLVQVGMSFAKHAQRAVVNPGCGRKCNGEGDSVLGVGCRDIYTADINGIQSRLGPRSQVNAWTGELGEYDAEIGDAIFRRIQIAEEDIDVAVHKDALYFIEGVFVGLDDAGVFGNGENNASYRRVNVSTEFEFTPAGLTAIGLPAILAWHDHGLGVGVPDPSVTVNAVDVPNEGRYYVASKVIDLGDGMWQYEYGIFNLNSDRSAGRLSVPKSLGVNLSDIGFHDVNYHSGEPYDNTDWSNDVGPTIIVWSSPATFEENPDSNALRWGMMYNFWFTADAPPGEATAWISLFKPGTPTRVTFAVPTPAACGADLDDDDDVGFGDLLLILAAWGPCDECPEDLDEDGIVGFTDIVTLLAEWGPCP